jgi:hypothetical protein
MTTTLSVSAPTVPDKKATIAQILALPVPPTGFTTLCIGGAWDPEKLSLLEPRDLRIFLAAVVRTLTRRETKLMAQTHTPVTIVANLDKHDLINMLKGIGPHQTGFDHLTQPSESDPSVRLWNEERLGELSATELFELYVLTCRYKQR